MILELNKKLQELRKQKGLTQEELADILYVSRTAISKWESGRGLPTIDSLMNIAKYFCVSIDELLSGDEILQIASEDSKKKENNIKDLVFGLLDVGMLLLLFLPLFGQKADGIINEVSLVSLMGSQLWLKIIYFIIVIGIILTGILTLALQNYDFVLWKNNKNKLSLILSVIGVMVFIICRQSYAAIFTFAFLIIKGLMLIKRG